MTGTRRSFVSSLAAPILGAATSPKPNIVLVISDDQGYGDLSLHGNPHLETPNLDRIGKEGVQFTQFHSNPVCSPTRASVMTGRYNYRTGVVDTYIGRSMMYPDEVTLPEVLRRAGYRTGIFGKWHLGDCYPMRAMDQGFEESLVLRGGGLGQPSDIPGGTYFDPMLIENGRIVKKNGYCTDVFFNQAMQFIDRNGGRNPFFAYLATNAPHDPLLVDEKYVAPFRAKGLDEQTAKVYGMVRNLDENVGRLLKRLDERKLAQDTILIFMTDNGPQRARFNANMRGVKGSVYEGGIRVPFFLRWPRAVQAGKKVERIAAHIDIMPTLLDACGATGAAKDVKIDGRSLVPLLRDNNARWPDRTLFFQWHRGDVPEPHRNAAARTQRYKLVNGKELYDLEADAEERNDIAAQQPALAASLRKQYDEWFADVSSTRGFAPPRISIGSPHQKVVTLTQQDWRGPKAVWGPNALGHWEVNVEKTGGYEMQIYVKPAESERSLTCVAGDVVLSATIAKGAAEIKLPLSLNSGPARIEVSIGPKGSEIGPTYVIVQPS